LLRRFGTPLWELDIDAGTIEARSIRNAGSGSDLWPADIEEGLMGTHDNDAARVFRYWINGQRRIVLPDEQRRILALWLALFLPRGPKTSENLNRMNRHLRDNPEVAIGLFYQQRVDVLAMVKTSNSELYEKTIADLGRDVGEEWLLARIAFGIRSGALPYLPDATAAYHNHLRHMPLMEFAVILCQYHWTWLYSSHGFVIGDNPLTRWHVLRQRANVGVRQGNVEITMPLSHNLCLRMERRKWNDHGQIMFCSKAQTAEYNRRQALAAEACVYAGSSRLLESIAAVRVKTPKRPLRGLEA
jgi:hypothetical protein